MKNISLVLFILLFISCKKEDNQELTFHTGVQVIVVDKDGNDLLDKNTAGFIPFDGISLTVSGDNDKNNGKPSYYPYYTFKDYLSPQRAVIRWSEELNKNYLQIMMDFIFSNTSTIIEWGNGLGPDTLRADIIFNKKKMEVRNGNLYLNEDLVRAQNSRGERIVTIQK